MKTRKHIRNMKLCSALLSLNQSPSKKKEKVGATSLGYVTSCIPVLFLSHVII